MSSFRTALVVNESLVASKKAEAGVSGIHRLAHSNSKLQPQFLRRADLSEHCCRSRNCGVRKIYFALGVSHPAYKISIGSCQSPFAPGKYAHVSAEAWPAGRS